VGLRLVVAVLAVLAALGCLAAHPHPWITGLAVMAALGVLAASAVSAWREREAEHRAHLLALDEDRDRLVALIDEGDLTIADLHVELDALRAELADAQESGPVDDPQIEDLLTGVDDDTRRDGAIRLYDQCRELIDLTACQRSALDEARAEIGRLRQALHTEAGDVRRISAVAAECRRLCDDEHTDRQALVDRRQETLDEATGSAS
jgi:hypothetical protein